MKRRRLRNVRRVDADAAAWGPEQRVHPVPGTDLTVEWDQAWECYVVRGPGAPQGGGPLETIEDLARALDPVALPEPVRAALIVVAVALVAVVTAAAGPIAFVALAAPQIGRRLAKAQGTSLLASAAVGALLLVAADLIAQHAFGDLQLPVGVITVSIGGIYLIWLLIQEARKA